MTTTIDDGLVVVGAAAVADHCSYTAVTTTVPRTTACSVVRCCGRPCMVLVWLLSPLRITAHLLLLLQLLQLLLLLAATAIISSLLYILLSDKIIA